MMRYWRLIAFIPLLLMCSTPSFGQAWSGVLAPERAITWSNSGIPGGVPTAWANCVTTACNTAYATPTAANINAALAGAPANTVVRIPAGTVSLSASIHANRSNVTLRGAGPTQTTVTLNGHNILMGNGSGAQGSTPGSLASTTLSTVAKGSTVLTVASTAGLSAGQIVAVLQSNPAYVNPTGNEGNENATWLLSPLNFFGGSAQSQAELVEIVTVDSGSQITIAAPGLSTTYSSGLSPKVISWSTIGVYRYNGVENMTVNASNSNFAVALVFCNYCWIKNVAVTNTARAGYYSFFSYRTELRDSYLSATNTAGAPTEYGIEIDRSSLVKIENNIFFGVTAPLLVESSSGLVVAYNYAYRTPSDNMFAAFATHRAHVWQSLFEGNSLYKQQFDFVWGSGSNNTVFRSRLSGTHPNATNYRVPLGIDAYNRYVNIVGSVLGDPTAPWMTTYSCDDLTALGNTEGAIYELGGNNGCGSPTPRDTVTRTSLMRWGNWDAVTYKASGSSHGTRWCTGSGTGSAGADAYNTACTAAETASADPTFPGLASPSPTLPASLYLAAKPSWWGAVAWPPIGPDVTGGNVANTGGHANKIPAQLCYEATAKNTGGFLTAFDANACYTNINANPPAAPTNLTIVP